MQTVSFMQRLIPAALSAGVVLVAGVVWAQPSQSSQNGASQPQSPGQPSSAQTSAGTAASARPGNTLDPNRRVCRRQETIGSRLRARTVCRTAAEWDEMDRRARENGKDLTNRSNINSTQPKMGGG